MEHFYEKIHGWSNFLPWYKEAVDEAPFGSAFAEIGVFRGRSAAYLGVEMANADKALHAFAIDSWTGPYQDKYKSAVENLKPVSIWVSVMRYSSIQAASEFKKKGMAFHMVNIDQDHSYLSVLQDMQAWWPLVRPGGFLMGDDYRIDRFPGVSQAVAEYMRMQEIPSERLEIGFPDAEVPMNTWRIRKEKWNE